MNNQTKIVGLTGGIGSGKSIVRRVFENLQIPVYDADSEAKKIINTSKKVISEIKKEFGDDIYTNQNIIDKKKLAKIIFNNKTKLEKINSIVHPAVNEHFNDWVKTQNSTYVIKEVAILFESGSHKNMDFIIMVSAPESTRIQRVMKRDNVSEEMVKSRIKNQMAEDEKIKLSDFIIKNDDSNMILPQILKIHNELNVEVPKKK